jgi:hypothetical protein
MIVSDTACTRCVLETIVCREILLGSKFNFIARSSNKNSARNVQQQFEIPYYQSHVDVIMMMMLQILCFKNEKDNKDPDPKLTKSRSQKDSTVHNTVVLRMIQY